MDLDNAGNTDEWHSEAAVPLPRHAGRHRTSADEPDGGPVPEEGDIWDDARPGWSTSDVKRSGRTTKVLLSGAAAAGVTAIIVSLQLWSQAPSQTEDPIDLSSLFAPTLDPSTYLSVPAPTGTGIPQPTGTVRGTKSPQASSAPTVPPTTPPPPGTPTTDPTTAPPAATTPAPPAWTTLTIQATKVLNRGESWQTNRIRLTLQNDGDLVIVDEDNLVRWHTNTAGRGYTAVFQDDGHFVVYDSTGRPWWVSGTAGHFGAVLVLGANGDVTIVDDGDVVWSAGTAH